MARRALTHFFTVPGESFLPVLDALRDEQIVRIITNRHEAGAAFAAEAYGKLRQRPAVCMATRGPGASNLMIGVQTAFYDGTPLLALVGMVPTASQASRAFQDFDLPSTFGSISKHAFMVNDRRALPAALEYACDLTMDGRPGPVVLGIPTDVIYESDAPIAPTPLSEHRTAQAIIDPSAIFERLSSAQRPALLVATEALRGAAAALLATFSSCTGLPVYTAWRRYSSFDNGHANFVGSLGLGAVPMVASFLAGADVVLAFGFALEQITAQSGGLDRADATIIQIACRADLLGARHASRASVVHVEHDPVDVAQALVQWCAAHSSETRALHAVNAPRTAELVARARELSTPQPRSGMAHLDLVMDRIDKWLPADAILTSDAGNFAQWLLRYIRFDRQRSYLGPTNGAMGYGLPAAIGAQLAVPDRAAWCIAGDGGFPMLSGEMETAARLDLNVTAVVINNKAYGTIRARQENEFPGRVSATSLGQVDFALLGRAMGWKTWRVTSDGEIDAALAAAAGSQGCKLIEVEIDPWPYSL